MSELDKIYDLPGSDPKRIRPVEQIPFFMDIVEKGMRKRYESQFSDEFLEKRGSRTEELEPRIYDEDGNYDLKSEKEIGIKSQGVRDNIDILDLDIIDTTDSKEDPRISEKIKELVGRLTEILNYLQNEVGSITPIDRIDVLDGFNDEIDKVFKDENGTKDKIELILSNLEKLGNNLIKEVLIKSLGKKKIENLKEDEIIVLSDDFKIVPITRGSTNALSKENQIKVSYFILKDPQGNEIALLNTDNICKSSGIEENEWIKNPMVGVKLESLNNHYLFKLTSKNGNGIKGELLKLGV